MIPTRGQAEAPLGIRRLLPLPRDGEHKAILMLRLFLDESGSKDDPALNVVSVGGALASLDAWERFEAGWMPVLRHFCISELHMKDFTKFKGEFTGWTESKRRALLERLFELLEHKDGGIVPIGATKSLGDYRYASEPKMEGESETEAELRITILGDDPIVLCYREVIQLADEAPVFHSLPDEPIRVVFDERSGKYHIHRAHDLVQKWRPRLRGISFDSSTQMVQLQLADFVAYELAKNRADPAHGRGSFRRLKRLDHAFHDCP